MTYLFEIKASRPVGKGEKPVLDKTLIKVDTAPGSRFDAMADAILEFRNQWPGAIVLDARLVI